MSDEHVPDIVLGPVETAVSWGGHTITVVWALTVQRKEWFKDK